MRKTPSARSTHSKLHFHALTPARWADLEKLFGDRGACGGCWCTYWIRTHSQFEKHKGSGNKRAFKKRVSAGQELGLIAYAGREPVGWCAFGPRERYVRLANSRILKPIDEQAVWSLVCFFVAKDFRRSGISVELVRAAARHAKKQGARHTRGLPRRAQRRNDAGRFRLDRTRHRVPKSRVQGSASAIGDAPDHEKRTQVG